MIQDQVGVILLPQMLQPTPQGQSILGTCLCEYQRMQNHSCGYARAAMLPSSWQACRACQSWCEPAPSQASFPSQIHAHLAGQVRDMVEVVLGQILSLISDLVQVSMVDNCHSLMDS